MEKQKRKYNPEWNKKRRIITISFNEKDLLLFNKKYGEILSGAILKKMIFQKQIKIYHVIQDETKNEILFQLNKLANNLNQIAWKVNSNYHVKIEEKLEDLNELIEQVKNEF